MDPASPAARLSNYRLDKLLGSGGMGSVYLARDLSLDRDVAIKFISPGKAADASARRRLIREARAAAALDHPNICAVHEVIDDPGGRACIVMQYIEGETLAAALARGPLDVRFSLSIAVDLASALSAAHKRGIVHRDVKPQNVIITPERRAKLLDFGVARHDELVEASPDAPTNAPLTATGGFPGTPAYMSPEQVQGRLLDGRSDLFALGAVLFECLTGRRAFGGRGPLELATAIVAAHPPPASSLRRELTDQHDELCRRLLAKDPSDRFNSADELLGALRVLLPDTARTGPSSDTAHERWPFRPRRRAPQAAIIAASAVVLLMAAVAAWKWSGGPLPIDPQAADWYRRGTEAIRDGAPHSARLALNEAIRAAPEYAPAYIRLAEAETELDDTDSARQALLRVSALMSSESRLLFEDRTRLQAVRALMLRDVDSAVRAYEELAKRNPDDPGVWLDLGRAQEASGLRTDARTSYEAALQINGAYAPAHLRRGTILGLEGRSDEALGAFDEAERVYRAAANVEGEVETLIRRGIALNGGGELKGARAALVRARDLARTLESRAQQIRAELTLSSVIAAEGRWTEAEKLATDAIGSALRAALESVAAEGLIELAITLQYQRKRTEADEHLLRAIELADRRGARTLAARATLQRASIMVDENRPAEALATAQGPLAYFQENSHRRLELSGLTIMARAHEQLGQYAEARALAERGLRAATEIKDEGRVADAIENLAGQTNALGALPEALEHRSRALEIHRRQNDLSIVGFDLVNTADLLVRLGRHAEATPLLDEIDEGVRNKLDAYMPHARRAAALRLASAAIEHRAADIQRLAGSLLQTPGDKPDASVQVAEVLLRYADALAGRPRPSSAGNAGPPGSLASPARRELFYWALLTDLVHDEARALAGAEETLTSPGATVSYEFEWRIAAIGAAAARRLDHPQREQALRTRAEAALRRLRTEWKKDLATYERRPDLVELRRKAGLNERS